MPSIFPCRLSAALTELGALRRDIDASRKERAKMLAAEQAMTTDAANIERAVTAHILANEAPNAVVRDAAGALWQIVGNHLRPVPKGDGSRMVDAVKDVAPDRSPAIECPAPDAGCDCDLCEVLRAMTPPEPGKGLRVLAKTMFPGLGARLPVSANGLANHDDRDC